MKLETFIRGMLLAMVLLVSSSMADNTAIVEAIKANPALLDSPEVKRYVGSKPVSQSTVTPTVQEQPLDQAIAVQAPSTIDAPEAVLEYSDKSMLVESPLRLKGNDEYLKRLMSKQIKGNGSKSLKRYGIEFFSNKNGLDLASLPVPENYKIVPKDVLSVILYGPKSDNMSLTVDKDGSVIIPSFGPLHVAGLSFGEAKKVITDALMAAFPNVGVTLNITQFSTIQVTLAGEVATPGLYNVSSFSTVKEALIAAGGLSKNGSMREVVIKRGGRVVSKVDLYRIIRGNSKNSEILLKAGDVIVVPVVGKSVVIEGDVKRPAIYEAKNNETLSELLNYAGGLKASANKNDIRITRFDNHDQVRVLSVSSAQSAKTILNDQDRVMVYSLDENNLRGFTLYGNVIKPGFWPLNKEGMSIKEVFGREIEKQGLRGVFLEQTYFDYAIIKRIGRNLKEEIIGFSLSKALSGEENIVLHSRDELYILNSDSVESVPTVKIKGECIARPGEYRYFDSMTLEALLKTAGSTCLIDSKNITVISRDPITYRPKVRVIDTTLEKGVLLTKNDEIKVLGYYTTNPIREAKISGEVYKPGTYTISKESTLKDIILVAGGVTKYAFLDRARVMRTLTEDGIKFVTQDYFVSLKDLDKEAASFVIKDKDVITIYNIDELSVRSSVTVNGEVYKPGSFKIDENKTTLKDIILAAGGVTDKASQDKIEVIRYSVVKGERSRSVIEVTMKDAMSDTSPRLMPYDEITVYRIPKWFERKSVKIFGKVKYPGEYTIEEGDRLSDLIKRAGGFTDAAYLPAAVFTREELKKRQLEGAQRQIKELEDQIMYTSVQPTQAGEIQSDKAQLLAMMSNLKEEVRKTEFSGRLSVNLNHDMNKFAQSASNVLLKNNDALYIPDREDSVVIQGEVLNPNAVIYRPNYDIDDYIDKAGGLKESADEGSIFVVHANGEAEAAQKGFFLSSSAPVGPGDIIVVPMRINTMSGIQFAKDITSILYQLAVSAAALHTIGSI